MAAERRSNGPVLPQLASFEPITRVDFLHRRHHRGKEN